MHGDGGLSRGSCHSAGQVLAECSCRAFCSQLPPCKGATPRVLHGMASLNAAGVKAVGSGISLQGRVKAMAAASALNELSESIVQLGAFLRQQRQLLPDDAWSTMITSHHTHLVNQIQALDRITGAEATALTQKVMALPFTDPLKQGLSQHISEVLLRPPKRKAQRDMQEHPTFECFLSQGDRTILADSTVHYKDKLETLAVRCMKIQLYYPSKTTVGRIVAVGVAAGVPAQDHPEFYSRVREFKAKLKSKRKTVEDLTRYPLRLPATPDMLPAAVLQTAYEDDPVGPAITAAELAAVADIQTLRKSKKEVKQSSPGLQLALPGTGSGASGSGASSSNLGGSLNFANMNPMHFMGYMMQSFMNMHNQEAEEHKNLRLQFQMPPVQSKKPRALMDRPGEEDTQQSTASDHTDAAGASQPNQAIAPCIPDDQKPALPQEDATAGILSVPTITPEEQMCWLGAPIEAKAKALPKKAGPKAVASPKKAGPKAGAKAAPKAVAPKASPKAAKAKAAKAKAAPKATAATVSSPSKEKSKASAAKALPQINYVHVWSFM